MQQIVSLYPKSLVSALTQIGPNAWELMAGLRYVGVVEVYWSVNNGFQWLYIHPFEGSIPSPPLSVKG